MSKEVTIKTKEEVEILRQGGRILARALWTLVIDKILRHAIIIIAKIPAPIPVRG